jgi:hypothetical protein
LNDRELLPNGEHVAIAIRATPPPKASLSPDSFIASVDPAKGRDEAERLFLATLADISEKLAHGTWYDLVKAAALLRQLLLDDTPLVHRVNRNIRKPISFIVTDYVTLPPLTPDHHWQNLDPSGFPGARTLTINLGKLLAAPCLTTNGVTASVKDLIKACANAKGGVHLGRAETSEEQAVLDWDEAVRAIGQEPSGLAIAGLCRVVLHGVRPLVGAIMAPA